VIAQARIAMIFAVLVSATLLLAPFQWAAIRWLPRRSGVLPHVWHRMARRLMGLRVEVVGGVPGQRPLLIVANHISWVDMVVLGSLLPVSFIAKSDVRSWPIAGWLAKMQNTVFIERGRRARAGSQAQDVAGRLARGGALVLFAEGTTGSGHRVLPFKSALFGAVDKVLGDGGCEYVTVQPVAIAYVRLHGLPLGRYHQARAAWPGDLALAPHLKSFLADGAHDVFVSLCEPIRVRAGDDRKELAERVRQRIRHDFTAAMRMQRAGDRAAACVSERLE